MLTQDLATGAPGPAALGGQRRRDRRRGPLALLTTVTTGLAMAREPRATRERFEQELRTLARARSATLRDQGLGVRPAAGLTVDVPAIGADTRARLEVAFEPGRGPDEWTTQLLQTAAHVAALLLEIERAPVRSVALSRLRPDGAAPLIGSSRAIRTLRERIERVAATDFTVLVEGAIDPQPHRSVIEVLNSAAVYDGEGEVAGAREDGDKELTAHIGRCHYCAIMRGPPKTQWLWTRAPASDRTRSWTCSGQAAWVRSIGRAIRGWIASSP